MNQGEILAALNQVARDTLDYEGSLEPGMRLVEDLELDSLRLLTLATEVEDHFQVCLDEDDELNLEQVSDLVEVIGRKLAEK